MYQNGHHLNNLVLKLDSTNDQINKIFTDLTISSIDNENADTLVSKLLELTSQRQLLLEDLVADEQFINRDYLQLQLSLAQAYKEKADDFRKVRQTLLQVGNSSQRHINVYKSIDANR